MLKKVNKAMLLSDVPSFYNGFKALAEDIGVSFTVESEWNTKFRVSADILIFGGKYLSSVNEAYYPVSVVILREGESPAPYIKMGITRFIFNYRNTFELLCSLYKPEATIVYSARTEYEALIGNCKAESFIFGDYNFNFKDDRFKYRGKLIFLSKASKRYLAEWLLNGTKDNSKRMILCNLRKKFGKDFLREINRYGDVGGKHEQ